MLKLKIYPDPVLRVPCKRVAIFDPKLRETAQDMLRIMLSNRGIGIAAPQVGISRRLMICWDGQRNNLPLILVNPQLMELSGEQIGSEGCLSFPETFLEIKRADTVKVKFQDLKGSFQTYTTSGLLARCVLHEYDHLEGKLLIDYGKEEELQDSGL